MASIVPPPFGSGYSRGRPDSSQPGISLQLCRPLSGAVIQNAGQTVDHAVGLQLGLWRNRIAFPPDRSDRRSRGRASIVPPPFGSGYVVSTDTASAP